jgi:hypothetical protein
LGQRFFGEHHNGHLILNLILGVRDCVRDCIQLAVTADQMAAHRRSDRRCHDLYAWPDFLFMRGMQRFVRLPH